MRENQIGVEQLRENIALFKDDIQNQFHEYKNEIEQNVRACQETTDNCHQELNSLKSNLQDISDFVKADSKKIQSEKIVLERNLIERIRIVESEFQDKIDTIKQEVDALQIEMMQPRIWYKDASVIISMLAVFFSLGTAMASYFQVDAQNKSAARSELRGIIQRLTSLPAESVEISNTYENRPGDLNNLLSNISMEYGLLASQASELANRIPNDISAQEYVVITQALMNHGVINEVPILLEKGLRVVNNKDINAELALLRNQANYFFIMGDVEAGRQKYQESMQIYGKYPRIHTTFVEFSNAYTEMLWANSEFSQGNCKQVNDLLNSAFSRLSSLPRGEYTENLKGQLKSTQEWTEQNTNYCKN